jgi:hypothetical protein
MIEDQIKMFYKYIEDGQCRFNKEEEGTRIGKRNMCARLPFLD